MLVIRLVAALWVLTAPAWAAGDAVDQRIDLMKRFGADMKEISDMLRDRAPYDADKVRTIARSIQAHSGLPMSRMFPKGSDGPPSNALPTVWTRPDRFHQLCEQLHVYAGALAEAAGNDRAGPAVPVDDPAKLAQMSPMAAFTRVMATCTACHRAYRRPAPETQ